MTTSRRSILAAAGLAVGSALAGCSQAARSKRASSGADSTTTPSTPASRPTASPTASSTTISNTTSAPSATPKPGGPARQVSHGPRTRGELALTFHGAGDPGIARDLLATFAAHHAKVTVLGVGTWLEQNQDVARAIVAGGHELGNHTYQHLDIDSLGEAQARDEIVRCRNVLRKAVGNGGAHFRPSQTQKATPLVLRLAGAAGYPICLSYDVDSLDFTDPGAAAVRANLRAARAGSIVSMHFGHPGTVSAMPKILNDLAARGLTPVTATTLLRP